MDRVESNKYVGLNTLSFTQNFIHRFNGSTVLEEGKYTKKT